MLTIVVPPYEFLDERSMEIITVLDREVTLKLEHSLISLYRWEAKHHKPFLNTNKTREETVDYIRCMCIDKSVPDNVFAALTSENILLVQAYIDDPMSATIVPKEPHKDGVGRVKAKNADSTVTAETLYYQMIKLGIPFDWEKRHLNQLVTLIQYIAYKDTSNDKKSKKKNNKPMSADEASRRAKLNEERRAAMHTRG